MKILPIHGTISKTMLESGVKLGVHPVRVKLMSPAMYRALKLLR